MCLHTIAAHANKYKLKYVYNALLMLLFYDSIEARRSNANSATIYINLIDDLQENSNLPCDPSHVAVRCNDV